MASAGDGATAGEEADQPGLIARKHRHKHGNQSLLPVDDGRYSSNGTRVPRRTRIRRPDIGKSAREDRGRPRTDVAKLRDAKVLYDNSGKTADEVCKVVGVGRRRFFAYLAQQRDQTSQPLTASETVSRGWAKIA